MQVGSVSRLLANINDRACAALEHSFSLIGHCKFPTLEQALRSRCAKIKAVKTVLGLT